MQFQWPYVFFLIHPTTKRFNKFHRKNFNFRVFQVVSKFVSQCVEFFGCVQNIMLKGHKRPHNLQSRKY